MAKYQLTWMPGPSPRWRKKYCGKVYYFSGQPSKALSYNAAKASWATLKEQLDQNRDPEEAKRKDLLRELKEVATAAPLAGNFLQDVSDVLGVAIPLPGSSGPKTKPIIDKFLDEKRTEVEAGQVTGGRYDNLRRALEHFTAWHGDNLNIDGNTLPDYKNHCLKRRARFAQERLACVKQFIRFCWQREVISQLPRTFKTSVKVETGKPKTWDLAIFRAIYSKAPERVQLYMLLQLNCGMYSGDISDLRQDEVDWRKGKIHRARSKTPDNAPTTYKLWPETFKLLKKFRSQDTIRALLTETGKPLNVDELSEDGRRRRSDSIRQTVVRWCKLNGFKKVPPLKELRKTGSSLIAKQFGDATAVEYLGHSPRTVAQKYYLAVTLDDALDWLRKTTLAPTTRQAKLRKHKAA